MNFYLVIHMYWYLQYVTINTILCNRFNYSLFFFQTNHEHVFLQGEDRLYMSISDGCASQDGGCQDSSQSLMSIGNKIWQIIPISHTYLGANWPIRVGLTE